MDAMRGERVLTWLLEEGWILSGEAVRPRPAAVEHLLRVHPQGYLRSLEDPAVVGAVLGVPLGPKEARAAVELQRLATGGTIQGTRLALRRRGAVVHLGGGFHHASPERGTGLCLLNDVAVAIRRLRVRGFEGPVLVVDLDVHDGNGTRAVFADDPTVYTFSMHNEAWDEVEAVADRSVAFGAGVTDEAYLALLEEHLPAIVREHRPELVIYNAGTDVAEGDAFGDGKMTGRGILARDRFVVETVREEGCRPLLVVAGGGYGPTAWRPLARLTGWLLSGEVLELPDEVTVALGRARRIEDEGGGRDTGSDDPFDWAFGEEDLVALGVPEVGEARLLGRITRGQVVEGLERFGILDQVRARGLTDPVVELRPSAGFGPTVRVLTGRAADPPLVEVRLDRDGATLPGFELLRIEWLLLQHPGAPFRPGRPPLPGQEHPGLGILADVVAWLVTLCRKLELDGLGFVSSHFHVAALARRHLSFLRARDEARFRRIVDERGERGLAELSAAVEEGRFEDPTTGEPLRWLEVPMVVPLSKRLEEHLEERGIR